MSDRGWHRTAAILSATLVGVAAPLPSQDANPVVRTGSGWVRGFRANGVYEFLGLRYAAPPVESLRWMPPQPAASWSGVRDATAFGPTCAQITTLGVFAGPANDNEDCLFLNVFTPKLGKDAKAGKLPVLVWIHGGGLVDGESNDYDGSELAKRGPTVVVTINYRLSLLGYFAHPAIDAEGHPFGNYGLMDQQTALRWVQRNIGAFGGDAHNVTVGGQSSGASSTGAAVASPASAGLFHRAIIQSGSAYLRPLSLAAAETRGTNFAVAAGCGSGTDAATAACLRALPAARIIALSGTTSANGPYVTGMMVDGQILPMAPADAFATGQFNHMPVINGIVRDEGNFTIGITQYFSGMPVSAAQFTNTVTATYSSSAFPPGTVQRVLAEYPLASYATPQLALDAVTTDPTACRVRHANELLADQVPVYAYEFAYRDAPYYFPPMPDFVPLAAHTIDIQFYFPLYHGGPLGTSHPLNKAEEKLSRELVNFWTTFARTGNPNGAEDTKDHPWPRYRTSLDDYSSQDIPQLTTLTGTQYSDRHHCGLWDSVLTY